MRLSLGCVLLALAGCDPQSSPGAAASAAPSGAATVVVAPPAAATATASAAADPEGPPATTAPMPPRPIPIGSSGPVKASDPPEKQMMAIAYTLAMVAPRSGDPAIIDKAFVEDTLKKLEGAVRGIDKGNTPANPAKAEKGSRKLLVEMGKGCTDRTPALLVQRAGTTLKAAHEAGVLVIACHDDKVACHQLTRDPKDVLCHAAPRR